jgi:SAM-dependent methyltransferase
MPDWGEILADPEMQRLRPNPELLALLPEFGAAGVKRVLDAGCGAGRHLLPLARAGFFVLGVDREAGALKILKERLTDSGLQAVLARAELRCLPIPDRVFDLVVSINVINHGRRQDFQGYCQELDRVLTPGGYLLVYVSPREFGELVRRPETRELEPGTLVEIATPDGNLVHHFPTPEELRRQFSGYEVRRWETIRAPIPFMRDKKMPQLIFWGRKGGRI